MRSFARRALVKVTPLRQLSLKFGHVPIPDSLEWLYALRRIREAPDAGQDVYDGFGGEARHSGAADVFQRDELIAQDRADTGA